MFDPISIIVISTIAGAISGGLSAGDEDDKKKAEAMEKGASTAASVASMLNTVDSLNSTPTPPPDIDINDIFF